MSDRIDELQDGGPPSGLFVLGVGVALGVLGFFLVIAEDPPDWLGQLLLGIASIGVLIGCIAIGAELALDRHDWKRRRRTADA